MGDEAYEEQLEAQSQCKCWCTYKHKGSPPVFRLSLNFLLTEDNGIYVLNASSKSISALLTRLTFDVVTLQVSGTLMSDKSR